MQMVMQMVMPMMNYIGPMVHRMLMDHNEMSKIYMTSEGDDCSSPPSEDQMMGYLDAMRVACKDICTNNIRIQNHSEMDKKFWTFSDLKETKIWNSR